MLLGSEIIIGQFISYLFMSMVSILCLAMSYRYGTSSDKNILLTAFWLVVGLLLWTRVYVFMFTHDVTLYLSFHVIVTIYVLIYSASLKVKGE